MMRVAAMAAAGTERMQIDDEGCGYGCGRDGTDADDDEGCGHGCRRGDQKAVRARRVV